MHEALSRRLLLQVIALFASSSGHSALLLPRDLRNCGVRLSAYVHWTGEGRLESEISVGRSHRNDLLVGDGSEPSHRPRRLPRLLADVPSTFVESSEVGD